MRLKRTLVILAITALTMGLIPAGGAIAGVSGVSVDTVGTPMTVHPVTNDVQMMTIKIVSDPTGDTLVKLTATYTGTATADVSTVRLYDGGSLLQAQSLTGGQAVFSVTKLLAGTSTILTVKADVVGTTDGHDISFRLEPGSVVLLNSGAAAMPMLIPSHGVTIDGTPPVAPEVTAFSTVNIASGGYATVSGTAEPNAKVSVVVSDGSTSANTSVTANASGKWTSTPAVSLLADGTDNLTATAMATDSAGNGGPFSAGMKASKDTVAPALPTFTGVPPYVNEATSTQFTIGGNAEAGTNVKLTVSSSTAGGPLPFGPITAAPGNTFSFSNLDLSGLADGTLTFVATSTDAAGNSSTAGQTSVTKKTRVGAYTLSLDDGPINLSNQNAWHVSGTAESGANISVLVHDGVHAPSTGSATANLSGNYSFAPPLDLSALNEGNLTVLVTQTDPAGNSNLAMFNAMKDTVAPTVTLDMFENVNVSNVLAVDTHGQSSEPGTINITITGTSGSVTKSIALAAAGPWDTSVDVSTLPDGNLTASVTVTDAAGNVSSPATRPASTKDTHVPATPVINALGAVNGANQATYSMSGTVEANTTVEAKINAVPGAVVRPDATTWTATFDLTGLPDGPITASVTATTAAGNPSTATSTGVKDTRVPAAPSGFWPVWVNTSNQSAVTFSGPAGSVEAGAQVWVQVVDTTDPAHTQLLSTAANPDRSWSLTFDLTTLKDGGLPVFLWQVDTAGNAGPKTFPNMSKDTLAPSAPTITSVPAYVNGTNKGSVTFGGMGAGIAMAVTVTVSDSGTGSVSKGVTTGAIGEWTAAGMDLSALADGSLTVKATVTDPAGNTAVSAPSSVPKDTVAPTGTYIDSFPDVYSGNASSIMIEGYTDEPNANVDWMVTSSVGATMMYSSTTADNGGYFSFTVDLSGLADGTLTAVVIATDAAGNAAEETLTAPKDTFAEVPANLTHPTYVNATNQSSVTFSGTLVGTTKSVEPNAEVEIYVDDATGLHPHYFFLIADANGNWSKTVDLSGDADGPLYVSIRQIDSFANQSALYEPAMIKETVLPTIALARVSYNNGSGPNSLYQYYAWNRQAKITTSASEPVNWTWTVTGPFGFTETGTTATGTNFTKYWAPDQYAASGDYTMTLLATDVAGNTVQTPRTVIIPVYNYDFRITGTRILSSDNTTVAATVTVGNDYYAEVTVENLNVAAATPEVVFQQSQGAVQAFTSAAVPVPGESSAKYAFLWKPTSGNKSIDFFVWNQLAPAGRQALSTQSSSTITVN